MLSYPGQLATGEKATGTIFARWQIGSCSIAFGHGALGQFRVLKDVLEGAAFRNPSCSYCHIMSHTVDGRNPANQLIGILTQYLQGFSRHVTSQVVISGFLSSTVCLYIQQKKEQLQSVKLDHQISLQIGETPRDHHTIFLSRVVPVPNGLFMAYKLGLLTTYL